LVTGSIPVAATNSSHIIASHVHPVIANPIHPVIARSEATRQSTDPKQGIRQNHQAYLATASEQGISISKGIEGFRLSCNNSEVLPAQT
jgi:hypothetical protein